MPAAIKFSSNQLETIKTYYSGGVPAYIIAEQFDVDPKVITRCLRKLGVDIKPRQFKFNGALADDFCNDYRNGLSINMLKEKYGMTDTESVLNTLKRYGVETRAACGERRYVVDDNFFEVIDTEEKAYLLGFILTDGGITNGNCKDYNTVEIHLAKEDEEHLEKIKNILKTDYKIHINKSNDSRALRIVSPKMVKDLAKYGVVPKKTGSCKKPEGIPDHLERHFWRGCIDGDGYIASDYVTFGFCGDYDLVYDFWDYCNSLVKLGSKYRPYKSPRDSIYKMAVSGVCKVLILQNLYKNGSIYLDRKFKLYRDIELKYVDG